MVSSECWLACWRCAGGLVGSGMRHGVWPLCAARRAVWRRSRGVAIDVTDVIRLRSQRRDPVTLGSPLARPSKPSGSEGQKERCVGMQLAGAPQAEAAAAPQGCLCLRGRGLYR